jgi:transposase-like protein
VVEQPLDAVRLVLAGASVTEVAAGVGVSRQTLHCWLRRYRDGWLATGAPMNPGGSTYLNKCERCTDAVEHFTPKSG